MDCDNCKKKGVPETVSRYAFDEIAARQGLANRRAHILNIILIVLLLVSWLGFFVYESQFEDVVITAEQSADTGNNYAVGGDFVGE